MDWKIAEKHTTMGSTATTLDFLAETICFTMGTSMAITLLGFTYSRIRAALKQSKTWREAWKTVATQLNILLFSMAFIISAGCFTYGFLTRFSHYLKHATMGILANFWLSAFEAAYTRYSWLRSVSIIRQSRIKSTINGLALANPFLFLSQFTLNILYYVYLENHEAFAVVFILYRIFALLSVSGLVLFDAVLLYIFLRFMAQAGEDTQGGIMNLASQTDSLKMRTIARWGMAACSGQMGAAALFFVAFCQDHPTYANLSNALGVSSACGSVWCLLWMKWRLDGLDESLDTQLMESGKKSSQPSSAGLEM